MPSAVADALLPAPVNPAQPPQGFWGNAGRFAYDALGLGEAAKALRGQMTPTEAQDFAFGAALGLIPMSRGLKPVQKGIRAYHGSPHDFDRFDMSKIGTGEGAQAYGHGLYFAENPKVAEAYKLDPKMNMWARKENWSPTQEAAAERFYNNKSNPEAALADIEERIKNSRMYGDSEQAVAALRQERDLLASGWRPPVSRMYEVNINASPDSFLDWDKPLSKQPHVQDALYDRLLDQMPHKKAADMLDVNSNAAGDILYRKFSPNHREATEALKAGGIPGIKYLDQGSRTAGEGSRNYVVFDDKLIDIIKKYGLAALGLPPAMTAGSQIWNSQTQQ
jgi:hypothetical protein